MSKEARATYGQSRCLCARACGEETLEVLGRAYLRNRQGAGIHIYRGRERGRGPLGEEADTCVGCDCVEFVCVCARACVRACVCACVCVCVCHLRGLRLR